jgi:pantetheine-phosphate adenylyltransferase
MIITPMPPSLAFIALFIALIPPLTLIYRIVCPRILTYPWTKASKKRNETVVFAGSFNPPHNGHIAMIKYLASTYENVILVIGMNPNKVYKVSPQTRADILHKMIAVRLGVREMDKSRIRVKVVSGYIWRFCYSQNADIMIRGIRTWKKDGKEERALHILNTWGPIVFGPLKWPLKTVFMEGDTRYLDLSSTLIREACANQNARENGKRSDRSILEGMVPKQVEEEVIKAYS